ncbi:MAG: hypothetical protein IRY85_12440 [Micromonosporaceae bacterium]|nr:hypothetical protein [Micromonosporaceae bacterium]
MTPDMAAASIARLSEQVEAAWSTDQRTLHRARELRLSAWAFVVAGRGGVLGDDVDPETVVAALGLIAPEALRAGWEAAGRVGPAAVAVARLAECASWGERRLSGVVDARLVELLDRVVTGADATAMPIFAATRRLIRTTAVDSDGARVALALHALSEFRTAALLLGSRAVGLEPVELLIAGPEGEQEALTFGWTPPFPSRLSVLRRYALAAALADRMMGRALAGLTSAERVELVTRLTAAARAAASV